MLDIIAQQLRKKGVDPAKHLLPKHIAFGVGGRWEWAKKHNADIADVYRVMFSKALDIAKFQTCFDIPIVTINLLSSRISESDNFSEIMDELVRFFEKVTSSDIINKHKVKVSILGKWYDLPGRVIEPIKRVIDETKDYDSFFLNLCINYDGRDEIVDACKMMGRRITAGKLSIDSINRQVIKDELYSSYFLPPDVIVKTGKEKKLQGVLLWDSPQSFIYFFDKPWNDLREKEFISVIKWYQQNNGSKRA